MFVGFSDGDGAAQANRDIALRRAEAVRRAVSKAAETADLERRWCLWRGITDGL